MKFTRLAGLIALPCALSGCATIVEGTTQVVTVNTNPAGATCTLNRAPEGVIARVRSTPASVRIEKTKYDLTIKCYKAGYQEATFLDHSGAAIATFGNAIIGGLGGWAIDSATGSDNKYDNPVNVTLVPVLVRSPRPQLQPAALGEPGS